MMMMKDVGDRRGSYARSKNNHLASVEQATLPERGHTCNSALCNERGSEMKTFRGP